MTDISSTTAKQDIPSMTIPEGLAKRLVLEKRETWFPRAKAGDYLGDCQLMIADISLAIRAAVEAEREECLHILWRMARECREANPDMERALLRAAEKIVIRARGKE